MTKTEAKALKPGQTIVIDTAPLLGLRKSSGVTADVRVMSVDMLGNVKVAPMSGPPLSVGPKWVLKVKEY